LEPLYCGHAFGILSKDWNCAQAIGIVECNEQSFISLSLLKVDNIVSGGFIVKPRGPEKTGDCLTEGLWIKVKCDTDIVIRHLLFAPFLCDTLTVRGRARTGQGGTK